MALAMQKALAATLALALAACAELRADQPLFSPADQGEPPLTEGVWIAVSDDCPQRHARSRGRFPSACVPVEIRRAEDGAWRAVFRLDLVYGLTARERAEAADDVGPYRVVVVPAVERQVPAGSYAPLYVGEIQREVADTTEVGYIVMAPIGAMPATAFTLAGPITCETILRDGPIEGLVADYVEETTPDGEVRRTLGACTPITQAAVREAARRTAIENIGAMTQERYVYVRAN